MFQRILMVCTGNICRSPMAEGLLAARLAGTGARVTSAGLAALVGHPADPLALEVMGERGLDLSAHRARQLTIPMVLESELVLVMERQQQRGVEAMCPSARGRVRLLGQAGGFEIPDPYRRPRPAFAETLRLIERALEDLEATLWPGLRATRKASA